MNLREDFFGRGQICDLLKKRVLGLREGYRQNVALLGGRHVGKSTLLKHFMSNLDGENVIAVYLDLENKDFPSFLTSFTGSLLYNYSKAKGLPLHKDINLLLESTKRHLPNTVSVINKIYKDFHHRKPTTSFLGLLALPEIFTHETGQTCVLILDEFQDLGEMGVTNAFQHLGKKIMTQKKCLYVVASSYPQAAHKILSEGLALLFGNFEVIAVEPFDFQTSREFLRSRLQEVKISASLEDFLIDFTAGYPLYLHLICRELNNLIAIHKQKEIFIPVLARAVENTLFDRWGAISRHFELMINDLCAGKNNKMMPSLLISLANGKHKMDELCADLDAPKNQLSPRISRLNEQGIVVKNGNFHYLGDKLFKYWIKYIFQQRLKDVEFDFEKRRARFEEEFHAAVENVQASSDKNFSSRIMELLHCFDNESFSLNGRKYKLPLFLEVVPLKIKNGAGHDFDAIKATTAGDAWFIILKDGNFGEAEVGAVLEESRKMGKRPERCLIVSLKDVDENTRLRALQERFWIWSAREINTLSALFDKPYIIR
jgi:AAA+ ATPase superfamily predicted ATPase